VTFATGFTAKILGLWLIRLSRNESECRPRLSFAACFCPAAITVTEKSSKDPWETGGFGLPHHDE